jgi:hypothetical protein
MLLLLLQHHVRLSASAACGAWLLGLGVGFGGADLRSLLNNSIADDLVVVLHHNVLSCRLKFAGATSIALMVAKACRLPRFPTGLSHSLHALFAVWFGDPVMRAHLYVAYRAICFAHLDYFPQVLNYISTLR